MFYNDDRLISKSFNYVKMREMSLSRMLINGKMQQKFATIHGLVFEYVDNVGC